MPAALLALSLSVWSPALPSAFGDAADLAFADRLWRALESARLVGRGAIQTRPYPGRHPHGAIVQRFVRPLDVAGETGELWVLRSYGGERVDVQSVAETPGRYLQSVSVMYRRAGYDPSHRDWFWVSYLPDGTLDRNPQGRPLAGRIDPADTLGGCIACHSVAPGGDLRFDREAR